MAKRKWHQRVDGEWFPVTRLGHRIGCCDCGLVHRFDFKIVGKRIWIRAFRDYRATNGKRTQKLQFVARRSKGRRGKTTVRGRTGRDRASG